MIEAGLIAALLTEPSISSLVADRITPVLLPEEKPAPAINYPAITFQVITGSSKSMLTGTGPQKWRVQLDGWGNTYLDAASVRDAVLLFLSNNQVTMANGITVTFILIGPNGIPYSGGDELFRCSFDVYAIFTFPANS